MRRHALALIVAICPVLAVAQAVPDGAAGTPCYSSDPIESNPPRFERGRAQPQAAPGSPWSSPVFDEIPLARRATAFRENEGGWAAQLANVARHVSA